MSDPPPPPPPPGDSGQQYGGTPAPPPPPPSGAPSNPPPPQQSQPPPDGQQPPMYGAPGYAPQGYGAPVPTEPTKRADAKIAGGLVILGAVISIIGIYLPWISGRGESINGTGYYLTSDGIIESPGTLVWFPAVPLIGFGIALIAAGRVLAVAILAVIAAVIAEFIGLGMVGIANDMVDISSFGGGGASLGVGVILQPIAPLIGLAGGIVALVKRR